MKLRLQWLNLEIGLDQRVPDAIESTRIEYRLFGFTPEDISRAAALQDDRPYAGLVYLVSQV